MAGHPMNSPRDFAAEKSADEGALLDAGITRALASAPSFVIPVDFAARVAAVAGADSATQPMQLKNIPLRARQYGRYAGMASLCVLLAMIVACAHRAAGNSPLWISAEIVFCIEFALIAVWLVTRDLQRYFFWPSGSQGF
jgi:hypothetical protein